MAVAVFMVASCYDDSALKTSIADLQKQLQEVNTVLNDLKAGKVIKSVTQTDDGYTFTMSDGTVLNVNNGKPGLDGAAAQVIEAKISDGQYLMRVGSKLSLDINVTGVEFVDAFAPSGWVATLDGATLTVMAPKDKRAAREGRVVVVATGGNSLVLLTLDVLLAIEDFSEEGWNSLVDDPQYGGSKLYGDPDEYYSYHANYRWTSGATGIAFDGFYTNWGSTCFSSGGEAISNYVNSNFKDAGYLRQLEIPVAPEYGSCFVVHYGGEDVKPMLYLKWGPTTVQSIDITLTNYLANSTIYGDGFFGPLAADSFIAVKATGYDADGKETGTVSTNLITGADVAEYLAGTKQFEWKTWNLSSLGEISSLSFAVYGSEDCYGEWGFNAPAYFAYTDILIKN